MFFQQLLKRDYWSKQDVEALAALRGKRVAKSVLGLLPCGRLQNSSRLSGNVSSHPVGQWLARGTLASPSLPHPRGIQLPAVAWCTDHYGEGWLVCYPPKFARYELAVTLIKLIGTRSKVHVKWFAVRIKWSGSNIAKFQVGEGRYTNNPISLFESRAGNRLPLRLTKSGWAMSSGCRFPSG
jgi:hypothetical protein